MKHAIRLGLLTLGLVLGLSRPSSATVITFNGAADDGKSSFTQCGFTFCAGGGTFTSFNCSGECFLISTNNSFTMRSANPFVINNTLAASTASTCDCFLGTNGATTVFQLGVTDCGLGPAPAQNFCFGVFGINKPITQFTSTFANFGNGGTVGIGFDNINVTPSQVAAPEIDPTTGTVPVALLAGTLLIMGGRRKKS